MGVRLGNGNWAVKTSKLLAYNDASGMFFNKEFDFTRATTATRVNKSGLIESVATNVPRIDFTDDTKGHLLLEPASTNLIPNSENLAVATGGVSSQNNAATTPSSLPSPDGGTNAFTFIYDGTDNSSLKKPTVISADQVVTFSVFIKKTANTPTFSENNKIQIGIFQNIAEGAVSLNLGDALNAATIGEWVRYSVTATGDSDGGNCIPNVRCDVAAQIDVFGWQRETSSFATSYIPTSGSSVTRNAELCNGSGAAQDFNSLEGVLYAEIAAIADDQQFKVISISDSSSDNEVLIRAFHTNPNVYNARVRANASNAATMTNTVSDITQFNKIAVKYKSGDIGFFVNGVKVVSNTGTFTFTNNLNQLRFEGGGSGGDFYGKAREVRAYTTALTDAELIALTT